MSTETRKFYPQAILVGVVMFVWAAAFVSGYRLPTEWSVRPSQEAIVLPMLVCAGIWLFAEGLKGPKQILQIFRAFTIILFVVFFVLGMTRGFANLGANIDGVVARLDQLAEPRTR